MLCLTALQKMWTEAYQLHAAVLSCFGSSCKQCVSDTQALCFSSVQLSVSSPVTCTAPVPCQSLLSEHWP